jgi:hypothetical protein
VDHLIKILPSFSEQRLVALALSRSPSSILLGDYLLENFFDIGLQI